MNGRMTTLSSCDLSLVTGGADPRTCTVDNPSGQFRPTQFIERSHAGPSTSERVRNGTNTLMSRGMSMLNDGRPTMPKQW